MKAAILGVTLSLLAIRVFAAVFVVDSVGDEPDADVTDGVCQTAVGTCTLRAAIEQANAIHFDIPGPGVHTISPTSLLPALTDDAGLILVRTAGSRRTSIRRAEPSI
jgi:CSLREA domain-containing protein